MRDDHINGARRWLRRYYYDHDSWEDVGDALGVASSALRRIVTDHAPASRDMVLRWSAATGTPVSEIVDDPSVTSWRGDSLTVEETCAIHHACREIMASASRWSRSRIACRWQISMHYCSGIRTGWAAERMQTSTARNIARAEGTTVDAMIARGRELRDAGEYPIDTSTHRLTPDDPDVTQARQAVAHMSIKGLARAAKIDFSTARGFLRGTTSPTIRTLRRVEAVIG